MTLEARSEWSDYLVRDFNVVAFEPDSRGKPVCIYHELHRVDTRRR